MGIVDTNFRTVTCDSCKKTITYEQQQSNGRIHIDPKVLEENPWLKSNRVVLTADGRNFGYCSDLCEVAGLESKQHNMPEALKVEIPTGGAQAQIQAAAAAAKQREDATKAIKSGEGTKLHTA